LKPLKAVAANRDAGQFQEGPAA